MEGSTQKHRARHERARAALKRKHHTLSDEDVYDYVCELDPEGTEFRNLANALVYAHNTYNRGNGFKQRWVTLNKATNRFNIYGVVRTEPWGVVLLLTQLGFPRYDTDREWRVNVDGMHILQKTTTYMALASPKLFAKQF